MKKIHFVPALIICTILANSCSNNAGTPTNSDSASVRTDSIVVVPANNSSATNPSLADTAFAKKDTLKDTSKRGH